MIPITQEIYHVWIKNVYSCTSVPTRFILVAVLVRYCTTNCIGSTFPTAGSLQASSDSSSVSERPRTTVSVGALHPGLHCWHGAASAFRQPSPDCHTAFRLNTYGSRAFSVAGPMVWNSLPDFIRHPTSSTDCFRRLLKTYLFARY